MQKILLLLALAWLLTGCVQNQKIVVPSYTAPNELTKIEQLKSGGEASEGAYLSFAINPNLNFPASLNTGQQENLSRNLFAELNSQITQVGFITIHPVYDLSHVVLEMEVLDFDYQQAANNRKANLTVNFQLTRGVNTVLSKSYSANVLRVSADANRLPTENQVLQALSQDAVRKFVSDISPTKTNQLREFLPLPTKLESVFSYAKKANYQTAIETMENYAGKRDMEFYYNLAILYEAQGSKQENLAISAQAKTAYQQAIDAGGSKNKLVVDAKAKFDNFYRLLELTQAQQQQNRQLQQQINQDFMLD